MKNKIKNIVVLLLFTAGAYAQDTINFSGTAVFDGTNWHFTGRTQASEIPVKDTIIPVEPPPVVLKDTVVLDRLKAFPSAYGGGAVSVGGRGGVVVLINTLNYSAPLTLVPASGSLEAHYVGGIKSAFENTSIGNRYIIPDVSGTINGNLPITYDRSSPNHYNALQDGIYRSAPNSGNISFYGQLAPEGGLTLYRSQIRMIRQRDIVLRYLRVRTHRLTGSGMPIGDDSDTTPIKIGANNSIVDHCSVSHGGDKALILGDWLDGYPLLNLTAQWNYAFDSASMLFSVDGINGGAGDWDVADNVSWIYNMSMSSHRTPNIGGGHSQFNAEVQNNLIQAASDNATRLGNIVYGSPRVNHIGNYYQIESPAILQNKFQNVGSGSAPLIYSDYNFYKTSSRTVLEGKFGEDNKVIYGDFSTSMPLPSSRFTSTNMYGQIPNPAPLLSPFEAKDSILAKGGASRSIKDDGTVVIFRDSYDQLAINNFNAGIDFNENWTGFKAPTIPQNKRPEGYYKSIIGIPEWFVQAHGIKDKDEVIEFYDFEDYVIWNKAGYPAIEIFAGLAAGDYE